MPYTRKRYGTRFQHKKYKRCVRKVKRLGTAKNPYAVCRATVYHKSRKL